MNVISHATIKDLMELERVLIKTKGNILAYSLYLEIGIELNARETELNEPID